MVTTNTDMLPRNRGFMVFRTGSGKCSYQAFDIDKTAIEDHQIFFIFKIIPIVFHCILVDGKIAVHPAYE